MAIESPIGYAEFITYLETIFKITNYDLNSIMNDFHSEMREGLLGHKSSLKMIPSFVDRPKGKEKGKYLALDFGGTNLRVLAVKLDGKGGLEVLAQTKFVIKKKVMHQSADDFFDFIVDCIKIFLSDNNISTDSQYNLAFTFSFPVDQTGIASGRLIVWTKGFTAKGVEGEDVIELLRKALKRNSINCIKIAALANDTVGTLVAKSYNDNSCDMGVILGTGTNACYTEKISNIQKFRPRNSNKKMIVNMEWGNFNKLRLTPYDIELDRDSNNPGCQYLEKMVSGMYLGEISRRVIIDLIRNGLIFKETAAHVFSRQYSLKTEQMSLIESDISPNYDLIEAFLIKMGVADITLQDKIAVKRICHIVSERAAKIAGVSIASVIKWMDPNLKGAHTVGIDGTLFEKYPGFAKIMENVIKEVFVVKTPEIKLVMAKDGSGIGAAIIAAVAANAEK